MLYWYYVEVGAMDWNQIVNTVAAGGICACAAVLWKIQNELAGFREWRKYVDATLRDHGKKLDSHNETR